MKLDDNTVFNVIGSGVSSWIAVLYLVHAGKSVVMHRDPNVIIRRIGESTVPYINEIACMLEMTDDEFLERVNGHFKYGTFFRGWNILHWIRKQSVLQQHSARSCNLPLRPISQSHRH